MSAARVMGSWTRSTPPGICSDVSRPRASSTRRGGAPWRRATSASSAATCSSATSATAASTPSTRQNSTGRASSSSVARSTPPTGHRLPSTASGRSPSAAAHQTTGRRIPSSSPPGPSTRATACSARSWWCPTATSLSGLVIVLTLPVNEEEGHLPYLSQSAYPTKGTTVGGRTDDPRRERTRDALARHRARAGAGQRQRGVPRAGDLADRLLSLAQPAGTLRGRRRAPAPAARPGGAPGGDGARSGAAGARDRDQRGHLGLPTDRGLPRPDLAGALGAQHRAAAAGPGRAGPAARAGYRARAAGGAHGPAADPTDPGQPSARPLPPAAAPRGGRARGAPVSGHGL